MTATRRVPAAAPPPTPAGPPQDGSLSARLDGLGDAEPDAPEDAGTATPAPGQNNQNSAAFAAPPGSGRFPLPPRRRRPPRGAPAPAPEPSTEQFPAVGESDAEKTTLSEPVRPDAPPAGLTAWRGRGTLGGENLRDAADDPGEPTQVGVSAVPGPGTEQDDADGPSTGYYVPDFDDEDDGPSGANGLLGDPHSGGYDRYDGDYPDSYGDDYDYGDLDPVEDDADGTDADAGAVGDDGDADAARAEEGSPAKQWLALAGQLALGVLGGAGVWLGFNWLWGRLPAAALVAALVVTMGLVWVVRKVRKAEDTQTTVLALLVGLVVTVSPAALLLVSR